nr:dermokine-like [Setaria viridis]
MESSSPRATVYGTSSDQEEKAPGLTDPEPSDSLSPRVMVDTFSNDSEYVEQMEIVNQVPLQCRTIRKSAKGGHGQGRGSTATHQGTTIIKHGARGGRKGPPSFSSVGVQGGPQSSTGGGNGGLPSSMGNGNGGPPSSIGGGNGGMNSSTGDSNGGTTSSAGSGQGGPPSSTGTSSSGSCIKAPDSPSTKKPRLK